MKKLITILLLMSVLLIGSCKSNKTQRKQPIKQTSTNPVIDGQWYLAKIDTTYRTDGSRLINKIYKQKH